MVQIESFHKPMLYDHNSLLYERNSMLHDYNALYSMHKCIIQSVESLTKHFSDIEYGF